MSKSNRTVKVLALFWRYGYWLLMLASIYFLEIYLNVHIHLTLAIFVIIDGIYTVLIASFCCEHFICGMQNAYHQKMTPYRNHTREWLNKIKREGYFIGVLLTLLGFGLLITYLLKI